MSFTQLADDSPAKPLKPGGPAKSQEYDGGLATAEKHSMTDDSPLAAQKCGGVRHSTGQAAINIEAIVPSLGDSDYALPLLMSKRSTF